MATAENRTGRKLLDRHPERLGYLLIALSVVATVILAMRSADKPPSGFETGFFVLLAAVLQLGSAFAFSRRGRADPAHVNASFRRLAHLAERAANATVIAETASGQDVKFAETKRAVLMLSRDLSMIQEGILDAGEDWAEVHPELQKLAQKDPNETDPGSL